MHAICEWLHNLTDAHTTISVFEERFDDKLYITAFFLFLFFLALDNFILRR